MGKPNGQPLKDATVKQSIGSLINGLSSKPSNGNAVCHLDLNHVETKLEVHDKKGSAKKGKLKKEAANQGCVAESGSGHGSGLILMSCLNCYLHVMVCDANPKCPKCHKGDGLLDMTDEAVDDPFGVDGIIWESGKVNGVPGSPFGRMPATVRNESEARATPDAENDREGTHTAHR
ncbi:hypothetical protein L1987_15895 [Smallanthus sonchifolius]|uniref:Uncharacterized protein n=1 Tax=Smallanthus sonchifolius TaxID=185202 RepID=A0ACB9J6Q8_9ASTR|nr:hypothetical protein L1987_15895 [Smallanthus sonchifolius]